MNKALVVTVFTTTMHPKYKKRFKTKKKYHVACSDSSQFNVGDSVEFVDSRPVSKTIRFKVKE
jgi:ribosomal protein S17